MRRNRFEDIFSVLHAADNDNLPYGDKLGKIKQLIERVNQNFIRYAPIEANISVDEAMIPYFGRHGCKQYIKGKPIRFGYKAWVAALKSGYCLAFDTYQGRRKSEEKGFMGIGEFVVTEFANLLEIDPGSGKKAIWRTGTVREGRMDKCPLKEKTIMKKMERGVMDSAVCKSNQIIGVRWKDNSIVTILSNEHGANPIKKCLRYSAKDKKR